MYVKMYLCLPMANVCAYVYVYASVLVFVLLYVYDLRSPTNVQGVTQARFSSLFRRL